MQSSAWRCADQLHNTTANNNGSKHRDTVCNHDNTLSLTSGDKIHELIQELNEFTDQRWDFVTMNETWRTQKEALGRSKACHGRQSSSTRGGASSKFRTKNHGSYSQYKEVLTKIHLSLLATHGIRRRSHTNRCRRDVNLSTFADDILLISVSLMTTMLDDITTATTAHSLQVHTSKTKIIFQPDTANQKKQHGGSSRDEHRDPATRRKIKKNSANFHLPKHSPSRVRQRCKYVWETFTSNRLELTSPRYPLRDRLELFDATVTPSLFHASGTWTMTEEMMTTDDEDDQNTRL